MSASGVKEDADASGEEVIPLFHYTSPSMATFKAGLKTGNIGPELADEQWFAALIFVMTRIWCAL